MGKTFLLRLLLLICALDIRAEIHAYDLKGTGDLAPVAQVAHRYRVGDDPEDIDYLVADLRALRDRDAAPDQGHPRASPRKTSMLPGKQGHPRAGQRQAPRPAPDRRRRR